MKHGSLFSGIGGFDLAAEWMGWENAFHCEWNEFGQKVLHYYWPNAESYGDITKTDFTKWRGTIDIVTGGFPCQPYSSAGKRRGKEDDRHLWPEMLRAIREIAPKYIVGENVLGLTNWNGGMVFNEVYSDLEAEGYDVQAVVIPAAGKNAPHGRDRVWFVAHANGRGIQSEQNLRQEIPSKEWTNSYGIQWNASDSHSHGFQRINSEHEKYTSKTWINAFNDFEQASFADSTSKRRGQNNGAGKSRLADKKSSVYDWQNFPTQSPICGGDDGLPTELDGITFPKWRAESVKAYGNAIVPQVAYEIFKAIERTNSIQ